MNDIDNVGQNVYDSLPANIVDGHTNISDMEIEEYVIQYLNDIGYIDDIVRVVNYLLYEDDDDE